MPRLIQYHDGGQQLFTRLVSFTGGAFSLKGENCSQVLRQVCRRFPVQESNPRPITECEQIEVTQCFALDEYGNRKSSPQDSLVVCR